MPGEILPVSTPNDRLLFIMKEEGPVLKRFDSNQLLAAAVLAVVLILAILLRSV